MKTKTIYKAISTAALGAALTFGATFQAQALPAFTVDSTVLGGPGTFVADHIVGSTSTLVTYNSVAQTISGGGYLVFGSFDLGGLPIANTGLVNNYNLYATFNYTGSLAMGAFGVPNNSFNLTGLTYSLYGTQGTITSVQANVNTFDNVLTAASITASNPTNLLGNGSLVYGVASLNAAGGSTLTATNTYANTAFGDTFFTAPNPFYNLSFNSFTNNISGIVVSLDGKATSINATSTSTDFARAVPEPGSLALIGAGLLGFVATRRRKAK